MDDYTAGMKIAELIENDNMHPPLLGEPDQLQKVLRYIEALHSRIDDLFDEMADMHYDY